MKYLHFNKIAHRDLKPENLLLTADGNLKLADFGVSEDFSTAEDEATRSGMLANTKGSWPFFSPEMVEADEDNKYNAYKADVWAAGSCLWVFIFGKLPFWQPHDPHNPEPIFNKLIEAKSTLPSFPSRKSPELYEIFEKLFTADPVARPSFEECEQLSWIKIHTTVEIETALHIAGANLALSNDDIVDIQAGDVSTISANIKEKMLLLAKKSKEEVDNRGEHVNRVRSRSISDKKEVRKSLTMVYAQAPVTEGVKPALRSIPSCDENDKTCNETRCDNIDDLNEIQLELSGSQVDLIQHKDVTAGTDTVRTCCSIS